MEEPKRGMTVAGPNGRLGTVEEVIYENTGEPARVMIRREDGQTMVLQPGSYRVEGGSVYMGAGGTVFEARQIEPEVSQGTGPEDPYLTQRIGQVGSVETRDVGPGEGMVIPVVREEVQVGRRIIERGGVRVHKRVEEREQVVEQPAFREEVTVERVPLGQPLDHEIGSRQEGDTLIIPVLEEMLVVEKRLVLKEEIRITKRRIDETEQARIVLREEHVDIENLGAPESAGIGHAT